MMRPTLLKRTPTTLANRHRSRFCDDEWVGIRKKVLLQIIAGAVAFMLWFLGCLCYLFGSSYYSHERHSNLNILAVDYNGGAISQALQAAYSQLKGPGFIDLEFRQPSDYPTEADMYQAVWDGHYWGCIAVTANASARLSAALQGGEAAARYNPADALHYVWDQQYYPAYADSVVKNELSQLIAVTRLAYNNINGAEASRVVNDHGNDPAAIQVLLNPIQTVEKNIHAAKFGTAKFLNTVSMAMPVLMGFFFIMVLNGVLGAHNLYRKMTVLSSIRLRRVVTIIYAFGAGLSQTSYYWAFKEDWDVNANQFVLTWMVFWLLVHTHLVILETIVTLAPMPVMPFVVLLWILINVSSSISPLELQPDFYHWGIALPTYQAYSILITIWTGGAHNKLYRTLPILFAWWVAGNITTCLAHIRACHLAYKYDHALPVDQRGAHEGKDIEAGPATSEETINLSRTSAVLSRQRTHEEIAREHGEVYGPIISPFVYGA